MTMSNFEIISHKPYIQRNYLPVASAKRVFKKETPILLTRTRLSQNVYCVKWTMSAIRGNRSIFLPLLTYILISSHYSLFDTRIVRILGLHCPVSSGNLFEITTQVVWTQFNFVPCYSSVIIQQQFLSSRTQMYTEICVIINTTHIYV